MGAVTNLEKGPIPKIEALGTSEASWTGWLGTMPRHTLDDFLHVDSRLIVLAPHPDDEILACAGLLAMHDARGGSSLILAATDGEASHAGCGGCSATHWADPAGFADLALVRRAESAEGLRQLALLRCSMLRFGLPDGELSAFQNELQDRLEKIASRGDTLVTTWRHDAHPDHASCGQAAARVAADLGCRLLEAPVWMWHWSHPNDPRVPWQRLAGLTLPQPAVSRKTQALAAHRSQLSPRSAATGPVLGVDMVRRAERDAEYFFG